MSANATSSRVHRIPRLACFTVIALSALVLAGAGRNVRVDTALNSMLAPYLAQYELPALAAAVVKDGKVIAAGAVGTRRVGYAMPVTVADRFHLGSATKAMTALLAAMFVEEGKLRCTTF